MNTMTLLDLQDDLTIQHRHARGITSVLANGEVQDVPSRDLMSAAWVIYLALNRAHDILEEISAWLERIYPDAKPAAWAALHDRLYRAHVQGSAIASLFAHGEVDEVPAPDAVCAFEALLSLVEDADKARAELARICLIGEHPGSAS